jgi:hypothetical protein
MPLSNEKDGFFDTKTTCFAIQGMISSTSMLLAYSFSEVCLEGSFVRKSKIIQELFGFLLAYSYLCTRFRRNRWQEATSGLLCCVGR